MKIGTVRKAIIAAFGVTTVALVSAVGDNIITMDESEHIFTTVVTGIFAVMAVWRVPNDKANDES